MISLKKNIDNAGGFTLIELMVAMFILAVGILGIAGLQGRAILQNSSAFDRTRANAVALAVLEELKRLPFDDANLTAGDDLDAGVPTSGGAPVPTDADHVFSVGLLPALGSSFTGTNGSITDLGGKTYQLFWNVERPVITIGTATFTPSCNIRIHVYWDTGLGRNHLEMTAVKYNNDLV